MGRGGVGEARPAGAGDEPCPPAGGFAGFPSSGRATPVPNLFFARLFPDIERVEELLVTLYIFYIQGLQRRSPFFVTGSELAADGTLMRALANHCGEGGEALGRGLALATERGSLLRVEVKGDGRAEEAYLPATPYNRHVAERLAGTELRLDEPLPPAVPTASPNIFALYEENIGAINPIIADELKDAEERYLAQWIEKAFREAVSLNKRSWRYIEAILRRYEAEGPDNEEAGRDTEADWLERRYARGKRDAGRLR